MRHHRRRGPQPGPRDRGDRRAGQARRRARRQPANQRPGPRDLSLALRRRPRTRQEHVRRREHRHHRRGIGPCYRDKVGRSHAIRLGDLYRPTFREQVEHIVAAKNRVLDVLYPAGEFKPLDAAAIYRASTRRYAERLQAVRRRHDRAICSPRPKPASGCCSKAPRGAARRRPRHVSVRHQQQQLRRRHRRAARRAGAVHQSQSSASSRRTPPASAAGRSRPSRTTPPASTFATAATNTAPSPAARALRLVRRGGGSLHQPAQRRRSICRDAARRAQRPRRTQDLHRLRDRRQADDALPQPRRRPPPREAGVRDAARLAGRNHRLPHATTTCRRTRRALSRPHQRAGRPARSRWCRSAPSGIKRSSLASIVIARWPAEVALADASIAPAAGPSAAAHRHHHGRQRPLGRAAGSAADRGASPRRRLASAARPRNVPG